MNDHVLTLTVFLPLAGVAIILVGGRRLSDTAVRVVALATALLTFGVSLTILGSFDRSAGSYQLVEQAVWSESTGLSYILGVDGLVNAIGGSAKRIAQGGRLLQTGFVRSYALAVFVGAVAVLLFVGSRL